MMISSPGAPPACRVDDPLAYSESGDRITGPCAASADLLVPGRTGKVLKLGLVRTPPAALVWASLEVNADEWEKEPWMDGEPAPLGAVA